MAPLVVENVTKHIARATAMLRHWRGQPGSQPQGQFLAIMGASGSGKSTLLHLMAGLTQADGGSVSVNGMIWSP